MNTEQAALALRTALHEVAPDVDLDSVPPEADLREELELDSLDFLRVVELLSEATGVRIDEEDYPRLESVRSAVDWLSTAAQPTAR
jgi:acyl carrier protein